MTEMTDTGDDYDEEEALGPSQAMPPLYALRTVARCPACGEKLHVYMLGCAAYQDDEDYRPHHVFHFLRRVEQVPMEVVALLQARCPGYRFDRTEESEAPYLMNHCPCGGKLYDDFVAGDVGAAFWPDTPDGFSTIHPCLLPIETTIPVVASYTIGGGEYLDTEHAERW